MAWCTWDLPRVNDIINDHDLFTDMVIANKQNATRTGVKEPADLAKVFVIFKELNKTLTVTDVDPLRHLMKRRVTKAFESNSMKVWNLNLKKKNSLIDFIPNLPEMAIKAATRGNILHGFYESGLSDRTKSRYPEVIKILGTCHSTLLKELYQKMFDNFTYLYSIMIDQGSITEDVFDEFGFPQDRDVNGKEVLRNAGISQESQQQSKWLTHQFQIKL